jgi:hypothetical protein
VLPGTRVAVDGVNGIAGCGSVQVGTWHQRSCMCVETCRDYTEEQNRFPIKVFYNVGRVAMPVEDWPPGRCDSFSTCAVRR